MTDQTAYVSRHPEVLAAVHAARESRTAYAALLNQRAAEIPGYKDLRAYTSSINGDRVVGIDVEDPTNPPAGWVYSKGKGCHVPARGKAGDPARAWLASVRDTPKPMPLVLATVGAPSSVTYPSARRDGTEIIASPRILATDEAVHVLYAVAPAEANTGMWSNYHGVPDGRWEREPLSVYYAAVEADDAARSEAPATTGSAS